MDIRNICNTFNRYNKIINYFKAYLNFIRINFQQYCKIFVYDYAYIYIHVLFNEIKKKCFLNDILALLICHDI